MGLLECDWALEDRSIEVMDSRLEKTVQVDRDDGREESHVQEGFGRQSKREVLIYPGKNPKWVKPNWQMEI